MSSLPMAQEDHPAHNIPAATEQYAGDVLPIPGEQSMGSGMDSRAVDYAIGKKTDPKITPMPRSTTNDWAKRVQSK